MARISKQYSDLGVFLRHSEKFSGFFSGAGLAAAAVLAAGLLTLAVAIAISTPAPAQSRSFGPGYVKGDANVPTSISPAFDRHPGGAIRNDPGGGRGDYEALVAAERVAAGPVKIDGVCASACTFRLRLPPEKLCITPRSRFGFHAGKGPDPAAAARATAEVFALYPQAIRRWISIQGGLTAKTIWMDGNTAAGLLGVSCRRS